MASDDFASFSLFFLVDEDLEPFFISLVALSFFGAAVFVVETTFGLLAVAGLVGAVLLADVAVGFAALLVFGAAVFVGEAAFVFSTA